MLRRMMTAIACGVLAFVAVTTGIFGNLDKMTEDVLYHHAGATDGNIRIIKIDEKTLNELGDYNKWNRDVYANLVETLCVSDEIKPAVIGFDLLFSGEKDVQSDQAFADVCDKYNNVVCGFSYVFTKELIEDGNGNLLTDSMYVSETVLPYDALISSTDIGFVNALMDNDDGVIRSTLIRFKEMDGTVTKSFSSVIYEHYMTAMGLPTDYPTDNHIMGFRYSGSPSQYESVSLCDVLDGTIPPEAFADCIVLVGAYSQGMMDSYFVPVDRGQQMYGVEIHANVIQAMIDHKTLESFPVLIDALCAAVVAILLAFICDKLSAGKTVIACSIPIVIKIITDQILFNIGYSTNHLIIPIIAILIAIYYIVLHYYNARSAKRSIEKAFCKYVAPEVVKGITKNGTYELKLGGENRDIAVLFVDIRGFTPLSESLEPEQVVTILNRYLEMTTSCVFRHGGTLDKFIGDATMAVFNAPFDTDDYVYNAVCAAWDIVQSGNEIEKEFLEKYGKHVGFGVGVNCGPAVVGNIGCDFRMDYTAIGDTVNTAARLEANAPKGTVYISDAVYDQLKERITVEDIGEIPLKGKSKSVYVYSVTGIKDTY